MEGKEVKLEDEVQVLKQMNEEPEKSIQNGEDDDASGTPPTNTPPEQQHTDVEKHKRDRICEFNPCKRSTRKRLDLVLLRVLMIIFLPHHRLIMVHCLKVVWLMIMSNGRGLTK